MRRYCLDTNIFIEAWSKYYSMKLCPDYWEVLDNLAKEGTVFCTQEVRTEIEKIEDDLLVWVKERPYFFSDITDEVQQNLSIVLSKFPRLVDSTKQRSIADPWVIAHAMADGAVVVTKESETRTSRRIKIPDVCKALSVPYMDDFEFLNEIGITFSAKRSS